MLGLKSETWKAEMRTTRKIYKTIIALALSPALQSCFADNVEYLISDENDKLNLPFSYAVVFGETRQFFSNMTSILAFKNATLEDIVKCKVMIADIAEWPDFNVIYSSYFPGPKPACSALGAKGLALGACVELECWALLSE